MLSEWLLSKTARNLPNALPLAYAQAQAGLWARARRCAKAWQAHQVASQNFLIQQSITVPKRSRVMVLGAGMLGDVPLTHLAATFAHVVLVDVTLLWPTRWYLRRFANVDYLLHDVTTLAQQQPAHWQPGFSLPGTADWVISLNLLSQLPLLPLAYAQQQGYYLTLDEENQFITTVCRAHTHALEALPCAVSCLADCRQTTWQGTTIQADSDFSSVLPRLPGLQTWEWPVVPQGEGEAGTYSLHQVGAWHWDNTP